MDAHARHRFATLQAGLYYDSAAGIHVTAHIIKGLHSPDLMGLRWGKPGQGLPSWVPDFSVAPAPLPDFPVPRELASLVNRASSSHSSLHIERLRRQTWSPRTAGFLDNVASVCSCEPFKDLDNRVRAFHRDAEAWLAKFQDEAALLASMETMVSTEDKELLTVRRQALRRRRARYGRNSADLKAELH
ncbi:hypothetical protein DOTSEDRAFT_73905 [Dothistroma septosporum NZE10]|uniref:Uncharacterized protein n=1 Tax=Dothistroma septosporum (strain NZE10 / CBS 128990) TaxID=675120 RepID=N1PK45_DOTSN|nr:hypothetical protein DOTSEDRAFT_73905 [Dothistroma septosporum NZE10]